MIQMAFCAIVLLDHMWCCSYYDYSPTRNNGLIDIPNEENKVHQLVRQNNSMTQ